MTKINKPEYGVNPDEINFSPIETPKYTDAFDVAFAKLPEVIEHLQSVEATTSPDAARFLLVRSLRGIGFSLEDLFTARGDVKNAGRIASINLLANEIFNDVWAQEGREEDESDNSE